MWCNRAAAQQGRFTFEMSSSTWNEREDCQCVCTDYGRHTCTVREREIVKKKNQKISRQTTGYMAKRTLAARESASFSPFDGEGYKRFSKSAIKTRIMTIYIYIHVVRLKIRRIRRSRRIVYACRKTRIPRKHNRHHMNTKDRTVENGISRFCAFRLK